MPHRYTDIPIRPSDRRNVRRSYMAANAFEAMLAIAAITAGASGLANPSSIETSALGGLFGVVALAWSVAYVISGLLVLYGLGRPHVRVEVVGLCVLASAITGNAVALVAANGWLGMTAAAFYIGWAAASVIRARIVVRLARIIELRPPER